MFLSHAEPLRLTATRNLQFRSWIHQWLETLQENNCFVCVIDPTWKSQSLGREECWVCCVLCSPASSAVSWALPKRLLTPCKLRGIETLFWLYTFTELKTEIHWPLHYCNYDNCIKSVPHTERKMKGGKLLLINLRNSGSKSCAGTPPEIILYKLLFSKQCHWILIFIKEQHLLEKSALSTAYYMWYNSSLHPATSSALTYHSPAHLGR